ncbi:OmpA family protein [Flavobacterium sp.]|uniref:OmpA family protein n=1 Tax=Flavobacterium sp. TaxID=239 RepID=UPI003527DAA1
MKRILSVLMVLPFATLVKGQELPANADPGKCYIKCITPDEFREVTETMVVSPSYKKIKTTPATFKTVEEKVLVKEASKKYVYVPAVYETIDVSYEGKAAATTLEPVAATFNNDSKTIETYPKVGRWEYKVLDDCPSANKEGCMTACFVEYPAQNTTVAFKTLATDATTRQVPVPGSSKTYKKQVVKTPARMDEIEIPAEYATIKRQVVDQPAQVIEEIVPEVTETVTRTELVKKGGMTVWEEVDCKIASGANILPILYELNSARITPESKRIIDEHLLKFMKEKPNLSIEIMSHTDSRGDDAYNMSLSQQRAQSVVNYLVANGISRNRLVAKGYGETRLKNRCANGVDCSEAEHQVNRRTEFRIIQ